MALKVEDGTGFTDSNSYVTLAAARAYALDRGVVLSAVDPTLSAQLIVATDFLESFADQYVGAPNTFTQALSWPRKQVMFDPDNPYPTNQIPTQLKNAQYEAIICIAAGIVLQPNVDRSGGGGFITREKTDVLETAYSERIGTTSQPSLPKVMVQLRTLLNPAVALRTVRI